MGTQRGLHQPSFRELIEIGPAVVDRVALEPKPGSEIVACYVLTRAAERAWEALNLRLGEERGALFWIGGAAGVGKTHFLNYALALDRKVGLSAGEKSHRLTLGLEITGRARAEDLEAQLLGVLARELAGNHRNALIWRQVRGAEALNVTLDQAHRRGIEAVTVAIDFGEAESDSASSYLATLAEVCAGLKHPKLVVLAAGRGHSPPPALAFEVAPADADEQAAVAIGRARRLKEEAKSIVNALYRGVDTGPFEARAIFPLHPLSVEVLRTIADPPGTIAEMARLVGDVLAPLGEGRLATYRGVIVPADLVNSPAVCRRVEGRLGEAGRAALKIARGALDGLNEAERKLAGQIIDTLVLAHFGGGAPRLGVAELRQRLPRQYDRVLARAWKSPQIGELLDLLSPRTKGVIRFESGVARFDPRGAGAPEVAAFNAALPLIRRFDATITAAEELPELKAKLKRLSDAMANALEAAHRTGEVLSPVLSELQGKLPSERQTALSDFVALASGGAAALLDAAADAERCDEALKTVAAYEALAGAAAAVPRLAAMREYLQATGLRWAYEDDQPKESRIAALENQCQLLGTELNPAALLGGRHNLDALQARFQQFRWSYVQEYRAAHERWREEISKLAAVAADARRHIDALRRLNSIAALGPPEGEALEPAMREIEGRVVPCDFEGPLAPEVNPRCPQCGFVLGARSPKRELTDLFERAKSALRLKLAALSKSAIARLIREHDRARRLEGFLRITQAAQTDALVRVLDDRLADYLARLIDENLAVGGKGAAAESGKGAHGRGVVRRLNGRRSKAELSKLSARDAH